MQIAVLALALVTASPRPLPIPDAFTPILAGYLGDETTPVEGSDGRWHVVYELELTNARDVPASVERIDVLDYDHQDRFVATLTGDALKDAMREISARPADETSLAPFTSKLVLFGLEFDSAASVPKAIVHRIAGKGGGSPGSNEAVELSYLAAPRDLTTRKPVVVGAPLAGEGWVVMNGCCGTRGAHRAAILPIDGKLRDAQRFAIDWIRVDSEGKLAKGDPSLVENHLAYDQPIHSVAAGVVTDVLDGLDDQVPGKLPDPSTINVQNVDGNHVIVDIGGGNYAFYAHIKKGTVKVKLGQKVRRGQELGRIGNTGNTSAPHLHFHIVNQPSALAGDGVPYVFDRCTLAGMLDPAQWYAPDSDFATTYKILPGDGSGPRKNELPLDLRIVAFPQ